MLVVLKCVVFRVFWSVLLSFSVFFPPSLPLIIIVSIIIVLISPPEILVQCDGCFGWGWVWLAGLVAGLQVGQAFVASGKTGNRNPE